MLTISKPLTTAQAHSYHEKEFANSEQNYYSQGQGVRGEWQGRLATEWGLVGEVRAEQFYRLAEGQHPNTGEQLVRHRFARNQKTDQAGPAPTALHRAGWDATFSAPKSVSITALVGGDDKVREAHGESVRVALDELERSIQARIGGNHPPETTGKMVAAKFDHDSARPVNGYSAPQLHTHVVIFNVTQTADGKTHALQPHELYRMQQYATAVYRSELAMRLEQLGYELERGKQEAFEIKGYSREYLEASSPRRQQIKQYLQATGLSGAEAAEIGAHRTRQAKIRLTSEEMRRLNLALAAQYGNDPLKVVGEAQERQAQMQIRRGSSLAVAHRALTYARDRNIEREAVVDERILLRDALKRTLGEATLEDIRMVLKARTASGEFVQVSSEIEAKAGRGQFTTAQMLAYERENMAMMKAGQELGKALVHPKTIRTIQREFRQLSHEQLRAVSQTLKSEDRITGFQGAAGSGKTTALEAVRQGAEREGYEVEGFAPTSRAAHKLENAGIKATTLQHFLTRGTSRARGRKHLYILDESSLASTRQVHDFFKRLRENDRVLLVGDIRQHQAVEAGRPFQQMQEAGMRTVQLEEILRPKEPELKRVVERLAKGEVRPAVADLQRQGRLHEIADGERRLCAIAEEYLRHPNETLVVSPDNCSRFEINRLVHESLQAQGKVGSEACRLTVLVNRNDLTGADRKWAAKYQPGDMVRYTRGSSILGLKAGEYVKVARADVPENLVTIRRENGQAVTYNPERLQGVNVYRPEERQFSLGDRVQFTAPFREQRVANRDLGYIENVDVKGNLRVRLESGRNVQLNVREHPHFDYGYAMTSYSSQGQSADRVIVHVPGEGPGAELVNRRFAYVALSRARRDVHVYTNDLATLAEKLDRDVSKRAAIETAPTQGDRFTQESSGRQTRIQQGVA